MPFSKFLDSRREDCKKLVAELSRTFAYVGILGTDVASSMIGADRKTSAVSEGSMSECGFVIKMHNGRSFFEYSLDDITGDKAAIAKKIIDSVRVNEELSDKEIAYPYRKTSRSRAHSHAIAILKSSETTSFLSGQSRCATAFSPRTVIY